VRGKTFSNENGNIQRPASHPLTSRSTLLLWHLPAILGDLGFLYFCNYRRFGICRFLSALATPYQEGIREILHDFSLEGETRKNMKPYLATGTLCNNSETEPEK